MSEQPVEDEFNESINVEELQEEVEDVEQKSSEDDTDSEADDFEFGAAMFKIRTEVPNQIICFGSKLRYLVEIGQVQQNSDEQEQVKLLEKKPQPFDLEDAFSNGYPAIQFGSLCVGFYDGNVYEIGSDIKRVGKIDVFEPYRYCLLSGNLIFFADSKLKFHTYDVKSKQIKPVSIKSLEKISDCQLLHLNRRVYIFRKFENVVAVLNEKFECQKIDVKRDSFQWRLVTCSAQFAIVELDNGLAQIFCDGELKSLPKLPLANAYFYADRVVLDENEIFDWDSLLK